MALDLKAAERSFAALAEADAELRAEKSPKPIAKTAKKKGEPKPSS